jgi:tetratricopeptide (TPR) repeat protein
VTRPCDSLSNRFDRDLCLALAERDLVEETSLDSGYESFQASGDRFVRETHGSGDLRIAPELYDRVIPLAETNKEVWDLLKGGRSVPWSRFHLEGAEGETLRNWILSFHSAEELFAGMLAPPDKGGLGISFDDEESGPARGPMEVYRDRKANCIEFVGFFLMAADLLGIPAVPMELFEDAQGDFVEHVRIGFPDPSSGEVTRVADLADGSFGPPAAGERWVTLTRGEFLSYFYNLKGVREQDTGAAEAEVDFALRLNPRNYLALYNKAYYAAARGKPTHALSYLLKSISAYPRYPLAYWNLMRIADQLDRPEIAVWAFEGYRALFTPGT